MDNNGQVLDFYETLGFEEIEIEDDLTALFVEIDLGGSYALITNEEGEMPESLKQSIVFACYSAEGVFLWSTSFANSHQFSEIWSDDSLERKIVAIQKHRETNDCYFN